MLDIIAPICNFMEQTIFTFGWPVTRIEFVILVINAYGIYLAAQNTAWTAPVSIVGVVAFAISCYITQFYSEVFLQIYFFIANLWLFVVWSATHEDGKRLAIKRASPQLLIYIGSAWILGTYVLGDNIDAFFIAIVRGCMAFVSMFTHETYVYAHKASAYPFLEAYAIIGQVIAMIMMIRRYIANWYIWIFINLVCIFTFTLKGGYGMALIFGFFTLMSLYGIYKWNRIYKQEKSHPVVSV